MRPSTRLHDHAKSGRIDGFIYAALGQIDRRVPLKPANWVGREEVIQYPTDFSAMSEGNIRRLSGRGRSNHTGVGHSVSAHRLKSSGPESGTAVRLTLVITISVKTRPELESRVPSRPERE